ncbi:MAG: DNA/RNA nuclease SfsA [Thermoprotei archaeon]
MDESAVCLGRLIPALFRSRINKFLAEVELGGKVCLVHVPNTGRLNYTLTSGGRVWLRRVNRVGRTRHDIVLAEDKGFKVVVDSAIQNELVAKAVEHGVIAEFSAYKICGREVVVGGSRLDFALCSDSQKYFLEVKGCTLAEQGYALYPDAPTARGRRHVGTLIRLVEEGFRGGVLFVALRGDVIGFKPNTAVDPSFSLELLEAHRNGVDVLAYRVKVGHSYVKVERPIPLFLD